MNGSKAARLLVMAVCTLAGCSERTVDILLVDREAPPPPKDGAAFDSSLTPPPPRDGGEHADEDSGSTSPDASGGDKPCSANLGSDPSHCGACGNVCSFANALPSCTASVCTRGACLPGFVDLDNMPETGCEYQCSPSKGGVETCDGQDNDCDGRIDEDTDTVGDVKNCGGCGIACTFLNAGASCQNRRCTLGTCAAGFEDANKIASDGCECAKSQGGNEVCDGFDNDCNGLVDDVPGIEASNDPRHCGACNANCLALSNATGTCSQGACAILACSFGFANADGNPANGCELACPGGYLGAAEVCDGIDNDCDGKIDDADTDLVTVANFCRQKGACAGSQALCRNGAWECQYGTDVELVAANQVISNETRCDGKDNDCDGCIDESFPQVGLKPASEGGSCAPTAPAACADDKKGICQGRGTFVCNTQGNGVACKVDQPGAAPTAEQCNGKDDNCDGVIDNSGAQDPARVKDAMVAISGGGLMSTVYVDAFEASRPDAEATKPGVSTARACSKPDALPWTNLTPGEAAAACAAAGKRLCTEQEWQRACQTSAAQVCTWSFGSACMSRADNTCNVYEHGENQPKATGNMPNCFANWATGKLYDMTGNVREWTQPRTAGENPLRGGAYDTVLDGSTCAFSFIAVSDAFRYVNSGFRCCSSAP